MCIRDSVQLVAALDAGFRLAQLEVPQRTAATRSKEQYKDQKDVYKRQWSWNVAICSSLA